jgi:uncharacterized membrane protein
VLFNMQVLTGVLVAAALLLARLADRADELVDAQPRPRGRAIGAMLMLLLLWMGSLEIDRAAQWQTFAQPWVVRQVGLSIFWSIFAVGCIALGFRTRIAAMRYFGLSLFAVTLLKVVVIDLSQVATGLRILSFMGLGLLLLGTSVLYGRLSPRILALDRARNEHPELAKVESQHG